MSQKFVRQERYIIFKKTDVEKFLGPRNVRDLNALLDKIDRSRKKAGKPDLKCVVVESDWPEYEPTWKAIEDRVAAEVPR